MGRLSEKLKVIVGFDDSKLNSGIKNAKGAVKDFSKTSSGLLSKIADAFGINIDKANQLGNSVKGLGVKLSKSGDEGVQAFGKMIASSSKLALGISGLGIGAAVIAFKQLNNAADNFRKTVAGAKMELGVQAYIDTYKQVFYDLNAESTRSFVEFQNNFRKATTKIGSVVGSVMMNLGNPSAGLATSLIGLKAANIQASKAKIYAKEIYQTQLEISKKEAEWVNMEKEAVNLKNQSLDRTKSTEERVAALNKAEELLRQRYTEEYDLQSKIADLMEASNNLAESTPEQISAANRQRATAAALTERLEQSLTRILSKEQSIAGAGAETKVTNNVAEKVQRGQIENFDLTTKVNAPDILSGAGAKIQQEAVINVKPVLDEKSILDLSEGLSSMISDLAGDMSEAVGTLVGDLINGENAAGNFANALMGTLGHLAISVGKTAIATGVAISGIKKALESLNPAVAIAAGFALVALGSAVRTSLSNAASGAVNTSSSVASSSYGSTSSTTMERNTNIILNGEFKVKGSDLVLAIGNENRKRLITA